MFPSKREAFGKGVAVKFIIIIKNVPELSKLTETSHVNNEQGLWFYLFSSHIKFDLFQQNKEKKNSFVAPLHKVYTYIAFISFC
jgi:hypothetical protein